MSKVSTWTYVWHPPAAVAGVCLEEWRNDSIKRKDSYHIAVTEKVFSAV